ncbi:MAG: choice-of-anchor tandem repeat GloVer-containing protein [Bryobacteraceae bacterium]|jgi:uncharacterized repeat protein (TIGR03803 family)
MSIRCFDNSLSLALCLAAAGLSAAAGPPAFRVVSYMNDLDQPAGILQGSAGVFYSEAGQSGPHAVLSITAAGEKTTLASVQSPDQIPSLLVSGANGRFYSTIEQGVRPAHVFSVTSAPGSQEIYAGQSLHPILTQNLPDGELLAMAVTPTEALWSLGKVDLKGNVTSFYQFPAAERPGAAIYASDGNYYGVSQATSASTGYVYRVTPSGVLTKLYRFPAGTFSGYFALPLIEGSDGNLYGATPNGGANGTGAIYKLTLGGQYTLLYSFPKGNLGGPTALIEGSDGNLYGATLGAVRHEGYSQLFRIGKGGPYSVLYDMKDVRRDGACQCSLVQGSDGIIYGSAVGGGIYGGGLYFALDAGQPKPAPRPLGFNPRSGGVGSTVSIWGSHLLSGSVRFNGVDATAVSNSGSNYLLATVPAGAASGPITVTTPGGTVTTRARFIVR